MRGLRRVSVTSQTSLIGSMDIERYDVKRNGLEGRNIVSFVLCMLHLRYQQAIHMVRTVA
jgi:hypothetical protein